MQRDENLVYINKGVNGQQIDAIHMGYRQTGAVYTCRSGLRLVTQTGCWSDPELESILTLINSVMFISVQCLCFGQRLEDATAMCWKNKVHNNLISRFTVMW